MGSRYQALLLGFWRFANRALKGSEHSFLEKGSDAENDSIQPAIKVDRHGMPLVPQPSAFKDDPLVRVPSQFLLDKFHHVRRG